MINGTDQTFDIITFYPMSIFYTNDNNSIVYSYEYEKELLEHFLKVNSKLILKNEIIILSDKENKKEIIKENYIFNSIYSFVTGNINLIYDFFIRIKL